jgi:hypothetical protein
MFSMKLIRALSKEARKFFTQLSQFHYAKILINILSKEHNCVSCAAPLGQILSCCLPRNNLDIYDLLKSNRIYSTQQT